MANGTFKMRMDVHRHGPRLMPNNCKNLNPPFFSLPSTFKWKMGKEETKKITGRKREDRESQRSQKENLKERGKTEKEVGEAK